MPEGFRKMRERESSRVVAAAEFKAPFNPNFGKMSGVRGSLWALLPLPGAEISVLKLYEEEHGLVPECSKLHLQHT